MKRLLFIFMLLITSLITFGQENKNLTILSTNNWAKEIIKFPVNWAPRVSLEGFEELRFAPYWSDQNSDQFWSLIMAWKVKTSTPLKVTEIEKNFEGYFEGLMIPNHWTSTFPRPNVLFIEDERNMQKIIGKMKLFDGFHAGKMIDLNIIINQYFIKEEEKSVLIFRISSKNLDHSIWKLLNNIKRKP
ncbi:hypothetical protein SAMN04489761_0923 [Tenacibaculum sp. MAR_2009_124]|uniref:hypothetical protein n=1 Tax=Tenacibaculum sp. MAR_2009_124 TaxID=1250059 RepID=UPI000894D55D|nr:hypothetical protein [Tenacibaculum sp. MAR_2009_124]SEB47353.1 hypothetical protein SAMN04489761_0923 [Tenacibaculum sp. MAR_2009_124]